jgi:hypothetical protein
LAGKLERASSSDNFQQKKSLLNVKNQRPFWLSPANYYILVVAITIAVFFVIWGWLHSVDEETPYIPAGISASFVLAFGVLLRELVLQRAYQKSILAQKRLDYNLKSVAKFAQKRAGSNKLTIEQNNSLIKEIEAKSKAAQLLGKHSEVHFEIFEICTAYLDLNTKELEQVNAGSPRISMLRKGRLRVEKIHKYHLLNWAAIESQNRIREAKINVTVNEKLENAQRALSVLYSALEFYAEEEKLLESAEAIKDFIVNIKVSHWIEQAERATFKENYKRAINHYRDALFFLARENERTLEHENIAEKINKEIEKLREISKNTLKKD